MDCAHLAGPRVRRLVYLLSGGNQLSARMRRKMEGMERRLTEALSDEYKADILEEQYGADAVNQSRYLERFAHCPLCVNTDVKYYPLGDDVFADMLEALRGAKQYIFLEYFIIDRGVFWDSILEILEEKARAGVDVRVVYDDVGCLYTLPKNYWRELEEKGIRCRVFNRFIPVLSVRLNNRDHRKFCIVDGHTAFTGGINLADEYINRRQRYGHWKDSAIRVTGEGAWSMTVMFLTMWEYICGGEEDYNSYRPTALPPLTADRDPGMSSPTPTALWTGSRWGRRSTSTSSARPGATCISPRPTSSSATASTRPCAAPPSPAWTCVS